MNSLADGLGLGDNNLNSIFRKSHGENHKIAM